jgi:hypothetical protein
LKRIGWWFAAWALLSLSGTRVGRAVVLEASEKRPSKFEFNDFYVVPLRVHVLQSKDCPDVHCQLTEKDVHRILEKVNKIWAAGGVYFYLESFVTEDAANQEEYKAFNGYVPLEFHLKLRPESSRAERMFHVYYVHNLSVNGVYLRPDGIFVKDTARLREVEGGIDEPLPRVTAHELGHALSLPHRQDRVNLMASGTTGFSLNDEEIERARTKAKSLDWAQTVSALARLADENYQKKNAMEAKKLYERLSAIPGDSPLKDLAKKRLLELK